MTPAIAIVGMACRYPDARTPVELWENVLAQRRAFRRFPRERLDLADYLSEDRSAPDRTYAAEAALLADYAFDRVHFRVAGSTFRSADLAHWLALDVAAQALADAGFPDGEGLPRDATGVILGNTLTGEFSRAHALRLRWPYVRRVLEAALIAEEWAPERRRAFLADLEAEYKAPFPPVGEETLAGSLSNTIAGRICNHFDCKGGGYTVDGACAASLLAVTTACSGLLAGDLDLALAGGVDLSLDPFELVGFAKVGALAPAEMRVYDARSAGFWPGEGCGFVALMRYDDALAQGRRVYAVIRGWGVSSDGSGGITRPEVEGQSLALARAYRRAGFGVETVTYFEGHGTGTEVGDATELRALARARRAAAPTAPPAAIGSIKANIGHTKAAAGVAGLIKATLALHTQLLPPTTGCDRPHAELTGEAPALRVLETGESWPADRPLRAGVSAMGFGGINSHLVLEGIAAGRRATISARERTLLASFPDAELFVLGASTAEALARRVERLLAVAAGLSRAELADLAARLAATSGRSPVRAAVVAAGPAELARRLGTLRTWVTEGASTRLDWSRGVGLGAGTRTPRLGFLFPGQGSPAHLQGGAWRRRFPAVGELYARAALPTDGAGVATEVAQPAIVTASLAALAVLEAAGCEAATAVGHSLGELTALHWAGACDAEALWRIATARGRAMAELGSPTGAMAGIAAGEETVRRLAAGEAVVLAGFNTPRQTVISGAAAAVAAVVGRAREERLRTVPLPVSHAFHSPLVAAAAPPLRSQLSRETLRPLSRPVASTVTGDFLTPEADLRALLERQVTAPVRFAQAVTAADSGVDLWLEVGPGQVLSGLAAECVATPVIPLDAGGPSLEGLWRALGAAFVLGAPLTWEPLSAARFTRPFDLDRPPRFLANPCERAPRPQTAPAASPVEEGAEADPVESPSAPAAPSVTPLDLVRQLVAERAELPPAAVRETDRLLGDLHLNSIAVSQLATEVARRLDLPPPISPTSYADTTVGGLAQAMEDLARAGGAGVAPPRPRVPPGVEAWVRPFTVDLAERPLTPGPPPAGPGKWRVLAPAGHPLAPALERAFAEAVQGGGIVVCLPPDPDQTHIDLLLEAAHAAGADPGAPRCVLVQHGGGAAALLRTLHLEAPQVITVVVDVPPEHPQAGDWVVAEALAASGHTEASYDAAGRRREPVLRLLPVPEPPDTLPLGPEDVLLVSGGGKGITAECALALARETGAALALLGRSRPEADAELAANLDRLTAAGVRFRYLVADVTDAAAVRAAVEEATAALGPVTALLHGAGTNQPRLLGDLDAAAFRRTLAPKVQGLSNLLAAVEPDRLRLLVTFGSIIARAGLPGEADYALANEWLTRLTERFGADHPACRCLAVEWSVWAGAGMGERLGRVDALVQEGIMPIPVDEGVAMLRRLIARPLPAVAVVVTGRFGELATLKLASPDLPLLRFCERWRVHYPGVELVVDADLSTDTDPYLADHVFQGERLLPAVMGLEAMAEAAVALAGAETPPIFEEVRFQRPVVVPEAAATTIRVAALARDAGRIELVLRSEATGFQVDHFRALCRWPESAPSASSARAPAPANGADPVPLDPGRDLYGRLLFHRGRFRRLRGYHQLQARACLAEVTPNGPAGWFGRYLPQALLLGDPAVRDAAIHAVQACIPHATLLPIGVDRLRPGTAPVPERVFVRARERARAGDTFVYDVEVTAPDGAVWERWEGLRLQKVRDVSPGEGWVEPLLGPYIERRVEELTLGSRVGVTVERNGGADRRARSDRAWQRLLGIAEPIRRRPDGKPEGVNGWAVSAAHADDLTLAVVGPGPLGCDLEPVTVRPAALWRDLLGPERFALTERITRETREDRDAAATRIWAAGECLKKAGAMMGAPLVLAAAAGDGWVQLAAGSLTVATYVASLRRARERLAVAVLVGRRDASL